MARKTRSDKGKKRGPYKKSSNGRKRKGTKKGQVRKTARRAYEPKRGRGRPRSLPTSKKYKLGGKMRKFNLISTHSTKSAAKKKTADPYRYRVVKGGKKWGVYRRRK